MKINLAVTCLWLLCHVVGVSEAATSEMPVSHFFSVYNKHCTSGGLDSSASVEFCSEGKDVQSGKCTCDTVKSSQRVQSHLSRKSMPNDSQRMLTEIADLIMRSKMELSGDSFLGAVTKELNKAIEIPDFKTAMKDFDSAAIINVIKAGAGAASLVNDNMAKVGFCAQMEILQEFIQEIDRMSPSGEPKMHKMMVRQITQAANSLLRYEDPSEFWCDRCFMSQVQHQSILTAFMCKPGCRTAGSDMTDAERAQKLPAQWKCAKRAYERYAEKAAAVFDKECSGPSRDGFGQVVFKAKSIASQPDSRIFAIATDDLLQTMISMKRVVASMALGTIQNTTDVIPAAYADGAMAIHLLCTDEFATNAPSFRQAVSAKAYAMITDACNAFLKGFAGGAITAPNPDNYRGLIVSMGFIVQTKTCQDTRFKATAACELVNTVSRKLQSIARITSAELSDEARMTQLTVEFGRKFADGGFLLPKLLTEYMLYNFHIRDLMLTSTFGMEGYIDYLLEQSGAGKNTQKHEGKLTPGEYIVNPFNIVTQKFSELVSSVSENDGTVGLMPDLRLEQSCQALNSPKNNMVADFRLYKMESFSKYPQYTAQIKQAFEFFVKHTTEKYTPPGPPPAVLSFEKSSFLLHNCSKEAQTFNDRWNYGNMFANNPGLKGMVSKFFRVLPSIPGVVTSTSQTLGLSGVGLETYDFTESCGANILVLNGVTKNWHVLSYLLAFADHFLHVVFKMDVAREKIAEIMKPLLLRRNEDGAGVVMLEEFERALTALTCGLDVDTKAKDIYEDCDEELTSGKSFTAVTTAAERTLALQILKPSVSQTAEMTCPMNATLVTAAVYTCAHSDKCRGTDSFLEFEASTVTQAENTAIRAILMISRLFLSHLSQMKNADILARHADHLKLLHCKSSNTYKVPLINSLVECSHVAYSAPPGCLAVRISTSNRRTAGTAPTHKIPTEIESPKKFFKLLDPQSVDSKGREVTETGCEIVTTSVQPSIECVQTRNFPSQPPITSTNEDGFLKCVIEVNNLDSNVHKIVVDNLSFQAADFVDGSFTLDSTPNKKWSEDPPSFIITTANNTEYERQNTKEDYSSIVSSTSDKIYSGSKTQGLLSGGLWKTFSDVNLHAKSLSLDGSKYPTKFYLRYLDYGDSARAKKSNFRDVLDALRLIDAAVTRSLPSDASVSKNAAEPDPPRQPLGMRICVALK